LVFAQGDPSRDAKGITAFVLERDRQSYGSQALHGKLGLRSSDSSELILDDVRVPDANRPGEIGDGFKVAMTALDSARYSVAAGAAIQIHGGYGFSDEFPVERYWRDARVNRLYEGTTQIQKLIIGRFATGIDAIA